MNWLPRDPSDGDDVDQPFQPGQVCGVPRVEPGSVSVGGGGDQKVHHPRSGLSTDFRDRRRKQAVAGSDVVVDRHGLWLIDFGEPVASQPGNVRPAMVVSSDAFHETGFQVRFVVPGTTVRRPWSTRVELEPAAGNGLGDTTYLQCDQLRSAGVHRLVRKLGVVDADTANRVRWIMAAIIDG
jgi:mRNA-degrading endonuclease toxin of MazEF toxin-antitoxin module